MSRRPRRVRWWRRPFVVEARPVLLPTMPLPDYGYERAGLDVVQHRATLERDVRQLAAAGGVDEGTGDAFDALIEAWHRRAVERLHLHHARARANGGAQAAARRGPLTAARVAVEEAREQHRNTTETLARAERRYFEMFGALPVPRQRRAGGEHPNREFEHEQGSAER